MCPPEEGRERSRSPSRRSNIISGDSIVPVIDIGPLVSGEKGVATANVAAQIAKACEEIGFFVVVNHGIPRGIVDAAWHKTLEFFDQPLEEKTKWKTDNETAYPYGYSALGGEVLSRGKKVDGRLEGSSNDRHIAGDLKEMFAIGPKSEQSGMLARRLPSRPNGFSDAFEVYYDQVNNLAHKLMHAFTIALKLPEDWFEEKMDKHISALRANNYPDQKGMTVPPGSIRCSAHTDYGTITILKSGGPGLQVSKDRDHPEWHNVPHVEDGFVINLGDLMRRWTNDRWHSTLHRVINPPEQDVSNWGRRLALAFFHNLNKDVVVEAIPSCLSPDQPALYEPIVFGDFLMLKHLASNGKADPDAHLKRKSLA